jgi:hypothetical protein
MMCSWVGKNPERVKEAVEKFKGHGYSVVVYEARLPAIRSAERAMSRFLHGDRYVPARYILHEVKDNPRKTMEAIAKTGLLDKWASFDTDVPFGTAPKLIRASDNFKKSDFVFKIFRQLCRPRIFSYASRGRRRPSRGPG